MKKLVFNFLFAFLFFGTTFGQDQPAKFTVAVSTDSILMDNYFQVQYILENADGQNFEAPDFSEDFTVVSGPNFSSSMSVMNGAITQNMIITYFLAPNDIGAYYILPASVQAGDDILETAPLEVMVHPNPDGIQQSPPMNNGGFEMEFGMPHGGGMPFGFDELFKQFGGETMPFDFEDFFQDFDGETMPENYEELFKQFGGESMPFDFEELLKQMEEQMPNFVFPEMPSPEEEESGPKKKKRKTTRI